MDKQIKYPKGKEADYKKYLDDIQEKIRLSENEKTMKRTEFNGLSVYGYYNQNERIANTLNGGKKVIDPKEGKVNVQTGVPESKLDAVVANLLSLNLGSEIVAYDENNLQEIELGTAMEDIVEAIEERTLDKELQYQRFYELLKHGTAYVEVSWDKRWKKKKINLDKNYDGKFLEYKGYIEKLEVAYEGPQKKLLYGPHVWLGDYTVYDMENQPYIFSLEKISFEEAKARFGDFENFKYVKSKVSDFSTETESGKTIYENNWTLTNKKDGQVEVIRYENKWDDHIQILINGCPMLPIGFPLSFFSPDGYMITKSVYKIFHHNFALGKSFVSSGDIASLTKILDLLLSMDVLKILQSITPPRANLSGQMLPSNLLFPGTFSQIDPQSIPPLVETSQGVTASEYNIYREIQDRIDKQTVSNTFTGQAEQGTKTATEVRETSNQARIALGRTVAASIIMETRITSKLIPVILYKYFDPVEDTKGLIDVARRKVQGASTKSLFNITTREKMIEGEGLGERQIIPVYRNELPKSKEIRKMELAEEKEKGKPIQKIFINSSDIKYWNYIWFVSIVPKEKDSLVARQAKFRDQIADMAPLIELGSRPNLEVLETQLAHARGKKRSDLFIPTDDLEQGGPEMSNASAQALLQGTNQNGSNVVTDF